MVANSGSSPLLEIKNWGILNGDKNFISNHKILGNKDPTKQICCGLCETKRGRDDQLNGNEDWREDGRKEKMKTTKQRNGIVTCETYE